ncbi:hypothetical protein T10_12594 [Trichinella papuae]|uniref:Uncharacterized protein n=1 Tax=Trichinella papuae TaxID=268474 RepID=A0A0V1M242_9BILA|nr:hypothetical protein T10_12594 [Trichinella papuae]
MTRCLRQGQSGSDLPFSCVGSQIREEPTAICCDPDEAFHRSISGRVDDHQETGLLQAGAKRDDPFPLRGHETSLLRRERQGQARPLLYGFLQPGRTSRLRTAQDPPEDGLNSDGIIFSCYSQPSAEYSVVHVESDENVDRCAAWRSSQGRFPRKIDFTWPGRRGCNEIITKTRQTEGSQFNALLEWLQTLSGTGVRRNRTRRTPAILTWRPFTPFTVIALVGPCKSNSSATLVRMSDRSDPLSSKQLTSFVFPFSPCAIARTTGNLIVV